MNVKAQRKKPLRHSTAQRDTVKCRSIESSTIALIRPKTAQHLRGYYPNVQTSPERKQRLRSTAWFRFDERILSWVQILNRLPVWPEVNFQFIRRKLIRIAHLISLYCMSILGMLRKGKFQDVTILWPWNRLEILEWTALSFSAGSVTISNSDYTFCCSLTQNTHSFSSIDDQ